MAAVRANLSWGEDYPALFLTAEDQEWFDGNDSVDLPDEFIARYRAALAEQHASVEAIREHCQRTGQWFPPRPA